MKNTNKTIQKKTNTMHSNILDTVFQEFNGHPVYGIEFILDELTDLKKADTSLKNDLVPSDWFDLTDY